MMINYCALFEKIEGIKLGRLVLENAVNVSGGFLNIKGSKFGDALMALCCRSQVHADCVDGPQ